MAYRSAEKIRRRLSHLPFVLTSGYSNVLAEEGHGDFELLQKPYSVEDLSRTLRQAMKIRQSLLTSLPRRGRFWP